MTRSRRIALRLAGVILAGVVSCSLIGALSAAPPPSYEDLLAQAKQDVSKVDFAALRYAYAESAQYNPYDPNTAELNAAMMKAMNAKDGAGAMKYAQAILEKNYLRINAHLASAICSRQLQQTQQAEHHSAMARGLVDSIVASGKGTTAETAMVVISVDEEYSVMGRLGFKHLRQMLVQNGGHKYDEFVVTDASGRSGSLFFNIDRLAAGFARQRKSPQ